MKKEDLEARVQEIEAAILEKQGIINQYMADLNVLQGHKVEAVHWLSKFVEVTLTPIAQPESPDGQYVHCDIEDVEGSEKVA